MHANNIIPMNVKQEPHCPSDNKMNKPQCQLTGVYDTTVFLIKVLFLNWDVSYNPIRSELIGQLCSYRAHLTDH